MATFAQLTLPSITQTQRNFGRDFIFSPGGQQNIEFGGATNDLLYGFNLNDGLHGARVTIGFMTVAALTSCSRARTR